MDDELNFEDELDEDAPSPPEEAAPGTTGTDAADPQLEHQALLGLHRDLLARYRSALLRTDSAISPELVTGDTAEELEASFDHARQVVARMREAVRREQLTVVPAGAPGRSTGGPSSAYEKIRSGLARLAAS